MSQVIRIPTALGMRPIILSLAHGALFRKTCLRNSAKVLIRMSFPQCLLYFSSYALSPRSLRASQISVGPNSPASPVSPPPKSPMAPKTSVFYAIVLHDFVAERTDELDAKAGDPISVVAQSNREWFVAKPIGRLGRPGLIPASFVEVRDPVSNLPIPNMDALIDRGDLPNVEDWKQAMISYKQNSISLGVIEDANTPISDHSYTTTPPHLQNPSVTPPLPDGILISASVVSFHFELDEYWFRVNAIFQPYALHDPSVLPQAKQLVLFRLYNDFYDFQVNLLDTFPREAGKEPSATRILPFMPGPSESVTDEITAARRAELDDYMHELCALNRSAPYILEHQLIRDFLSPKPGDVEGEIDPRYDELNALFAGDGNAQVAVTENSYSVTQDFEEEVRHTLGGMKLSERDDQSDRSYYAEDPTPSTQIHAQYHLGHQRINTTSSLGRNGSRPSSDTYYENGASRGSVSSISQPRDYDPSSPSSMHSSQPSLWSRSVATTNMNAPPVSAGNPQTAFIRIKIFVPDDVIAIRVHPKVTYYELMQKVQGRLGPNITSLRYRNNVGTTYMELENDQDLRDWLSGTEKHVLYAE